MAVLGPPPAEVERRAKNPVAPTHGTVKSANAEYEGAMYCERL